MKLQLTMLVCALALSACADHAARERLGIQDASVLKTGIGATQADAAGAASSQWVDTYASIGSRRAALASLQKRLDQWAGDQHDYFHAKAQCWLDAAQQTRDSHDDWGFVEEAIGQAATITMSFERGEPISAANPALRTVSTVRPDLWKVVDAIKADAAVAHCPDAQPLLACAEVGLMQAGHDAWIRSFANAEKRMPQIQQNLRESVELTLQCKSARPERKSAAVESPSQTMTLRADALFHFGGADRRAMLPAGQRQLDALAAHLKTVPVTSTLNITGYTDRLGNSAYNRRLSLQRARTVEQYLYAHGVALPIHVRGLGSENQRVDCRQTQRDELVQCLAPNRRVELEFAGADQSAALLHRGGAQRH